jgi:siroheme synthase
MMAIGYPQDIPVAIIERATTPLQRTLYGTLETIGNVAVTQFAQPPATIVIGAVVHALNHTS